MSPENSEDKPEMEAPESGVKVRMYDTGFGDCLLLVFRDENNEPYFVLIDCGVHHQYPDASERMQLIAKDIIEEEFFDRVGAGGRFGDANAIFSDFQVIKNPDRKEVYLIFDANGELL